MNWGVIIDKAFLIILVIYFFWLSSKKKEKLADKAALVRLTGIFLFLIGICSAAFNLFSTHLH